MCAHMNLKYLLHLSRSAGNSCTSRIILSIAVLTHRVTSRGSGVSYPLMVIFTVAGGSKGSGMGLVYAIIKMAQCIRAHGLMGSGVSGVPAGLVCIRISRERSL